MATPLSVCEKIATEFGVTGDKAQHPRLKQAYVTAQVQEQKAIVNRLIVDTAKATLDHENAKDDAAKDAYRQKLNGFQNDLRQMSRTLDFFIELEKELGKADEGNNVEHPDSF